MERKSELKWTLDTKQDIWKKRKLIFSCLSAQQSLICWDRHTSGLYLLKISNICQVNSFCDTFLNIFIHYSFQRMTSPGVKILIIFSLGTLYHNYHLLYSLHKILKPFVFSAGAAFAIGHWQIHFNYHFCNSGIKMMYRTLV